MPDAHVRMTQVLSLHVHNKCYCNIIILFVRIKLYIIECPVVLGRVNIKKAFSKLLYYKSHLHDCIEFSVPASSCKHKNVYNLLH